MLTITEWALARGIAQGMPLARLGAQYLDYASSRRTASALNLVQQKLVRLAAHHCRPELAAALGSSMKDWPARSDTIMRALDRLMLLGEPKPTLRDSPAEWLPDGLAAKLARAGEFEDFAALVKRIEAGGYGWWRGLPRLGEKSARAIVAWLKARETALGVCMPPTAMAKPKRPRAPAWTRATGAGFGCGAGQGNRSGDLPLVPLERFQYPLAHTERACLDGTSGQNRAPTAQLQISAANDLEAIQCWLRLYPPGHTHRAYRKEAERFLLWAVCERGKAVAALNVDDAIAYRDFLAALDPEAGLTWDGRIAREAWIGPKHCARRAAGWRPFAGALSVSSQNQALVVVTALCEWLTRVGYLARNPFSAVRQRLKTEVRIQIGRALSGAQWTFVLDYIERLQPQGAQAQRAHERLRFLLYLGYGLGLRLAELANARLGDLTRHAGEGIEETFWVLTVIGKGRKARALPLPDAVAGALARYLASRKLPADLKGVNPEIPLIGRLRHDEFDDSAGQGRACLAASSLYQCLKDFFKGCAAELTAQGFEEAAARVAAASTHWLRHTHGTLAVGAGVDLPTIRESLGHASLATTGIYVQPGLAARKRQMDRLFAAPRSARTGSFQPA